MMVGRTYYAEDGHYRGRRHQRVRSLRGWAALYCISLPAAADPGLPGLPDRRLPGWNGEPGAGDGGDGASLIADLRFVGRRRRGRPDHKWISRAPGRESGRAIALPA